MGCSSSSPVPGSPTSGPRFEAPVSGLSIALELDASETARLHFRNASAEPIRIYFLEPEVFRSFQSTLRVRDASGKVVGFTDVSPPHGYVPAESDFPLIAPGQTTTFTQTLPATSAGGTVEWTYSNSITEWKGGAQTLDGPTTPLFGGGPIPHIWTGTASTSRRLE